MALKEVGDPRNDPGGINALRLELLHNVQKVIIDLRLVAKLVLDLVQIGQCILHFQPRKLSTACSAGS